MYSSNSVMSWSEASILDDRAKKMDVNSWECQCMFIFDRDMPYVYQPQEVPVNSEKQLRGWATHWCWWEKWFSSPKQAIKATYHFLLPPYGLKPVCSLWPLTSQSIFFHTSSTHWIFSIFGRILCGPLRWLWCSGNLGRSAAGGETLRPAAHQAQITIF